MSEKLTKAQTALLRDMETCGAKSGNFWLDLGNPVQSLVSLVNKGHAEVARVGPTTLRSAYRITPAGRVALSEQSP